MADSTKSDESEHVSAEVLSTGETNDIDKGKTNSSSETDVKEKIKKKATLLFLQGKRSIYIRDFQAAAVALSESCQLFSQVYSEQDDAMADPYFYCGKALLELGRSESEVLGEQMQDEENSDDDDEDDNENDEGENEENKEKICEKVTSNENETNSNEKVPVENQLKADESGNKDSKTSNENESEDVNDLQLSWEYLELAKLIYLRKANSCKETAIKLAETFLCLGENGLESENYSVAIEDIKQALELQKRHLPDVDRRIAETYYQLGVAHSLGQNYDEAISNFKMAIEQLNKKISSLEMRKKMGDKKTEDEEKDAFYTMDGEIDEIRAVIKEVEEKIKDMHECKNQVKAELLKQVVSGGNVTGSSSSNDTTTQTSSIPATDISHLIKKKRKNDEEEANSEKKSKME